VLKLVDQTLQELGLMPGGAVPRYTINITAGESLAISVFVSATRFFQVKASEFMDLGAQYEAYCRAWEDFQVLVPQPLGLAARDGWSIMVTEGKHHVMADPAALLSGARDRAPALARQLFGFFEASARRAGQHALIDASDHFESALSAHFSTGALSRVASYWIEQSRQSGIDAMARVPQHGDFVFNNLASSNGRLVIFDWEDYGRCGLPGLDIFTLCLSLLEEDLDGVRAMIDPTAGMASPVDDLIRRACEIQSIPLPMFRRLVPFYLLVFLYLKRNYGVPVQHRLEALLLQLTPSWVVAPQAPVLGHATGSH
jgi:hypothetical protein